VGLFSHAILCVDDNPDTLDLLSAILTREGYFVDTTNSKSRALIKARYRTFNLFILDVNLEDGSGIDLCREIRKFDKKVPIIFYTADAQIKSIEAAGRAGAQAYLKQPVETLVLIEAINRLLDKSTSKPN
jgi:DNA-binding response OmpR family regulator